MARLCIPKPLVDQILKKVDSGELSPKKLASMDNASREKYFTDLLGVDVAKETTAKLSDSFYKKGEKYATTPEEIKKLMSLDKLALEAQKKMKFQLQTLLLMMSLSCAPASAFRWMA